MKIEELNLSVNPYNCLKFSNINTVEELSNMTIDDLNKIRNLGLKGKNEIINKLKELGLFLKEGD